MTTRYRMVIVTHTAHGDDIDVDDCTDTATGIVKLIRHALRQPVFIDRMQDGKRVQIKARALSHTFVVSEVLQ